MEKYRYINLIVSSSPHLFDSSSTSRIMICVILGLLPSFVASVAVFGARAIFLTLICVIACMAFEHLFKYIRKQESTLGDFSAAVTGILLAFNLPVNFPYWQAVIGCFVALYEEATNVLRGARL